MHIKGPEAVISLFEETFSKLEKRIQELEHASKNSTNSHKPPSTDGLRKPITKVCANRLIVKQVASWAIKDIRFI